MLLRPPEATLSVESHRLELGRCAQIVTLAHLGDLGRVFVDFVEIAVVRHGIELTAGITGKSDEAVGVFAVVAVDSFKLAGRTYQCVLACGHIYCIEACGCNHSCRVFIFNQGIQRVGSVVKGHVNCAVHACH